jgi:hypothetical protein
MAGPAGHPAPRDAAPPASAGGASDVPQQQEETWTRERMAPLVGLVVLLAFFLFTSIMVWKAESVQDPHWFRLLHLFTSIEALAFGGAGFFFGREIHRERADKAEQQAAASKQEARQARNEATDAQKKEVEERTKKAAMVQAIRAKATVGVASERPGLEGRTTGAPARSEMAELLALAEGLDNAPAPAPSERSPAEGERSR